MVGAGFMGRGIALQIATATPGMELVGDREPHLDGARDAYALGRGSETSRRSSRREELERGNRRRAGPR